MNISFKYFLNLFILSSILGCGKSAVSNFATSEKLTSTSSSEAAAITTSLRGTSLEEYKNGPVIYRSYNGSDYFFSTDSNEGPKSNYFPEEARFGFFYNGTAGTIPAYRCAVDTNATSHFVSTDSHCEGHVVEGMLGNIASASNEGLVAVNRYVNLQTNAHIIVTPADAQNLIGWKYEGTLGYATELQIPKVVKTSDDGEKYFGYYAGAMDGVGTGNYIAELQNYSNLIFIKSPSNFEEKLAECERAGKKAIITFDWIFLDTNFRLRADYAQAFESIAPVVERYKSTIAAFYGLDEPYANSFKYNLKEAEVYNAQETMGRFLKSKFPNIPIGVIFSTYEVAQKRRLFPSFDWFGFDCYEASLECQNHSVDWYFNELTKRMNELTSVDGKARFLMAVPQAGHPESEGASEGQNNILAQIPYYRQVAKYNSNVKVVMPFIWQTFSDGADKWIGAREMPLVKAYFQSFYYDFITGRL